MARTFKHGLQHSPEFLMNGSRLRRLFGNAHESWRRAMRQFVVIAAAAAMAGVGGDTLGQQKSEKEPVTLLGTLGEWLYPGSKWVDGATMQDGGNPVLPSTF